MPQLIYTRYAAWYRLLDPLEDHREEGASFARMLHEGVSGEAKTLLELGSGAGNCAHYMKPFFDRVTLTDLSPAMLELSRQINPECEHLQGDMRTLRLERRFDAVIAQDAVTYMSTEKDLRDVAQTIFEHLRPGGAALVSPDCTRESRGEASEYHSRDDGAYSLRGVEWMHDPDPDDTVYTVDYALLLRHKGKVEMVHDRHLEGLFSLEDWTRTFTDAGFRVWWERHIEAEEIGPPFSPVVMLCRRD
ncbi:methyltransferase domain-containing protein [bacterium]|nr:methyltransferase domain-containing protein [bacterium]